MKKGFFLSVVFALISSQAFTAELKAINFVQKGEISELEFIFDSNNAQASKFQVKEDKQIIIDFNDVVTTERVMRAFDTSEFSGGVVFVKAYKKPKTEKDIRVAIQLRDNVRSVLVRKPNRVILQIENRFGVFSQSKAEEGLSYREKISDISSEDLRKLNVPRSDSVEDILENLVMSGKKKYIGKKITLNLKNVSPEEIIKLLAETSGFNIILTEEAKKAPPVSINLVDIPWDQALDTMLEMNKLAAKKNGMILIINTVAKYFEEQEEIRKAKLASIAEEPLLTKIFPISFANIAELQGIIKEYLTDKRGNISKDTRTNSLIIKDTNEVIEKIKKIVELLDTQTPQVLIESKIVEVAERYSKEIGLEKGLSFGYDPFGTVNPNDNSGSFSFSTAPTPGLSGIFGLSLNKLNRLTNLNFQLNLMENEAKAKIISSPKIITKNNVKAEITQDEVLFYDKVTQNDGGAATNEPTQQNVNLRLAVTPQITNEGTISLVVELQKDSAEAQPGIGQPRPITKRNIKTEVLVDNGATVVVGGIYTFVTSENHSGIPFLKDIPLVGWLFRTKYNPANEKRELIIFLTPRIINQEEAGLVDKG